MESFSLKEEITKLEESPRRELNILGMFFDERKPDVRTKEQYQFAIKRHIKSANSLKVFDDDQILGAVDKLKEFCPGWTLDSVIKLLTK